MSNSRLCSALPVSGRILFVDLEKQNELREKQNNDWKSKTGFRILIHFAGKCYFTASKTKYFALERLMLDAANYINELWRKIHNTLIKIHFYIY